jgi:hypothetical protein
VSNLYLLEQLGQRLDERAGDDTVRDMLISVLLKVRPKRGGVRLMTLNRAQQEYSKKCGQRNIVLKARQLGITTYVAARYFIQTITRPGTLTVQVAHSEESAEQIFNIVRRFWEKLPDALRKGALLHSRANVRSSCFRGSIASIGWKRRTITRGGG